MSFCKRIFGFSLFVLIMTQAAARNVGQELAATPSPSPQETPTQAMSLKTPFEEAFERLEWRSIGPANMGGRTADIEGVPGDLNTVYVATASGGLWKTTNAGVTWKPIFERQGTISIRSEEHTSELQSLAYLVCRLL